MSDESQRDSEPSSDARKPRGNFVAVGFVCLLIYILSPIPVAWCLVKIGASEAVEPVWNVIYFPIWLLTDRLEFVNDFYEWQSGLFGF